jgi:arylsulfatase
MGEDDNTIVVFTTDNGTEVFTWPDGGTTPFAQSKGTLWKAASACRHPALARPVSGGLRCRTASCPAGLVPDLPRAAGNPTSPTSCSRA